jgi:hypothetical protein
MLVGWLYVLYMAFVITDSYSTQYGIGEGGEGGVFAPWEASSVLSRTRSKFT